MKQKEWFWCGAAFFALAMFISLHSIQEPLYAGIAGGLCALAAAILLGCGLRTDAREKSAVEAKCMEENQKAFESESQARRKVVDDLLEYLREWFDAQQQSYAVAVNQLQTEIATVTGEIQTLHQNVASESQMCSKAFAKLSKDINACSVADRTQMEENTKTIRDSLLELHTALRETLERQGKESTSYYKFMVNQPWNEIETLSEKIQSVADQVDSILFGMDSIQEDSEKQMKKVLERLRENNEALQEKMQYVCETMETQGKESRDAMDRVLQGYSDVTAQDIEVLTALARDVRV